MLFSRVNISCLRAKAHLVFQWCLYHKVVNCSRGTTYEVIIFLVYIMKKSEYLLRVLAYKNQTFVLSRQGSKIRFRSYFCGRSAKARQKLLGSFFFSKIPFYFKLPNSVKIVIGRTSLLNKFESLACKTTSFFRF